MSSWTVQSVIGRYTNLNDASNFGTNFHVNFKLKYNNSLIGAFSEPPKLEWNEVIMMLDHEKREYWQVKTNMYTHKPGSPTMAVWAQRYFRAYRTAKNLPQTDSPNHKGFSKLLDKNGMPVPGNKLGNHTTIDAQNKAVRDYLKSNGGILEIEVHDIPSIATQGTYNKERVLTFDCGVGTGGQRVKAWQHLVVNSKIPRGQWTSAFKTMGDPPGVKTTGYKIDPAPYAGVPNATLPQGGVW